MGSTSRNRSNTIGSGGGYSYYASEMGGSSQTYNHAQNYNISGSATNSSRNTTASIDSSVRRGSGCCCLWNWICCRCCCTSNNGRNLSSSNFSDTNNSDRSCNGFFCGCYINEENRPKWLILFYNITKTKIWTIIHVVFSIILLFGPPVQSLVVDIGKRGDVIFDGLRSLMLIFFVTDMTSRCITEYDYFMFTLCKRRKDGVNTSASSTATARISNNKGDGTGFTFGSFLFWCDAISTASILYDLSFINKGRYNTKINDWEMDNGFLVSSIARISYSFIT
ncbi:MAG: hypothetical protein ACI8RD_011249 [Bacillariaceae sp.]|jgi:hypothetical protein